MIVMDCVLKSNTMPLIVTWIGILFEDVKDFIECTDKNAYYADIEKYITILIMLKCYLTNEINSITTGILSRDLVVNIWRLLLN